MSDSNYGVPDEGDTPIQFMNAGEVGAWQMIAVEALKSLNRSQILVGATVPDTNGGMRNVETTDLAAAACRQADIILVAFRGRNQTLSAAVAQAREALKKQGVPTDGMEVALDGDLASGKVEANVTVPAPPPVPDSPSEP